MFLGIGPKHQFLKDAAQQTEVEMKKARARETFFDLVFDLVCILVVLLGSILMVYAINKFKKLRTRTNMYLKHYCIANIIIYGGKPVGGFLLTFFHKDKIFANHIDNCIIYNTDVFLLTLPLTFGFLLGIDYFILSYFTRLSKWCSKLQFYVFFVIYLCYLIEFIDFQFECSYTLKSVDNKEACIISLIAVLHQCALVCLKLFAGSRTHTLYVDYSWKLTNVIVFPWTIVLIFYFLPTFKLVDLEDYGYRWYFVINFILTFGQYGSAVAVVLWLPFLEKSFMDAYVSLWLHGNDAVLLNNSDTEDSNDRFDMYDVLQVDNSPV